MDRRSIRDMIGVTKQTISNLENKKTEMTKTQYIAIRAVLDYEMEENPNREILKSAVNLALHSDEVSEEDQKKIQAFVSGAQKTGLDSAAASGAWLAKLLKNKRD